MTETTKDKSIDKEVKDNINTTNDAGSDDALADVRAKQAKTLAEIRTNEGLSTDNGMKRKTLPFKYRNPFQAPEARPGFKQRWITCQITGDDVENLLLNGELGWEPRDHSTLTDDEKKRWKASSKGSMKGKIRSKNSILCEMPEELHRQMVKYYEDMDAERLQSVGSGLPNMAGFNAETGGFDDSKVQSNPYYDN